MVRILAIHAHPDDVEILAGGALALLADAGHAVTIATLTPDCGSHELRAKLQCLQPLDARYCS
jgi:LmbE family N-acetylglucosaminyl deacetylase